MSWTQGRRLASYAETNGSSVYFKYNADGIRTSKTVDGVKQVYTLNGTQVLSEEWTEGSVQHLMIYVYDAEGSPIGFRYRNRMICMSKNSSDLDYYLDNVVYDGLAFLIECAVVFDDEHVEFIYANWQDSAGKNEFLDSIAEECVKVNCNNVSSHDYNSHNRLEQGDFNKEAALTWGLPENIYTWSGVNIYTAVNLDLFITDPNNYWTTFSATKKNVEIVEFIPNLSNTYQILILSATTTSVQEIDYWIMFLKRQYSICLTDNCRSIENRKNKNEL